MNTQELIRQLEGLRFILGVMLHRSNGVTVIKGEQRDSYIQMMHDNNVQPLIDIKPGPGSQDITINLVSDPSEIATYHHSRRIAMLVDHLNEYGFTSKEDLVKKFQDNPADAEATARFLSKWIDYVEAAKGEDLDGTPLIAPEIPSYLTKATEPSDLEAPKPEKAESTPLEAPVE